MRFLPHEHAAVTAALQAHGVDASGVLFVKRRGRLHIQLPGKPDAFAFFRKKSTTLDAQGRWHDRVDYYIGSEKAEGTGRTWEEVLAAFTAWLALHR
ncbi:MAG: hypothetical protein ABI599_15910 [Flavobacteriales bacterium]